MTVRVKICGITNIRDAHRAVDLGADALGFVFHPPSRRCVTVEAARAIIATLPPFVTTVGLFVNDTVEQVAAVRRATGIQMVQLHGDEAPETVAALGPDVIKAIRVKDASSLLGLERYRVRAFLLDAHSDSAYGGTGRTFDWELANWVEDVPVILAGGLTPDNVAEAVRAVHPYAVDVSSGVEAEPGIKDPVKLKAFIDHAKGAS